MSSDLQAAKSLVAGFQSALDSAATPQQASRVCADSLPPGHNYRGVHPFNEISGPQALADTVWSLSLIHI